MKKDVMKIWKVLDLVKINHFIVNVMKNILLIYGHVNNLMIEQKY